MSKRRAVPRNKRLTMGYRIVETPPGASVGDVFAALRAGASGDELPAGFAIDWHWRNAPHLRLRSDDIESVWRDSARGRFRDLMLARVERDLVRFRERIGHGTVQRTAKRKPAAKRRRPAKRKRGTAAKRARAAKRAVDAVSAGSRTIRPPRTRSAARKRKRRR